MVRKVSQKTAIIRGHIDGLTIESPYNAAFVEALKTAVPADQRKFMSKKSGWLISDRYLAEVEALAAAHYTQVIDVRLVGERGLAEALANASRAEVEAQKEKHLQWLEDVAQAQVVIAECRVWIQARCAELAAQIGRYSERSQSSVKGELVRRKFMLEQTLASVEKPAHEMKDVERHSALAVVRYLKEHNALPD